MDNDGCHKRLMTTVAELNWKRQQLANYDGQWT